MLNKPRKGGVGTRLSRLLALLGHKYCNIMSKRKEWVSNKIKKLVEEGKPMKQAVAIAISMASKKFGSKG